MAILDKAEVQISSKSDTSGISKTKASLSDLSKSAQGFSSSVKNFLGQAFKVSAVGAGIATAAAYKTIGAYNYQIEVETKLATVMRQRMGATDDQINSVKKLTSAQQKLGIIGDEVQLAGAQQLSTFLNQTDSVEKLIPAMNNLLAQQKGYNATGEDAVNIGNMMGKVFTGQVGALTRVGISFDESQEKILKFGTEEEKAATLAQVITDNVGEMNEALAQTPEGQMKQLSNTFGDLQEQIGGVLAEGLNPFVTKINEWAKSDEVQQQIDEYIQKFQSWINDVAIPWTQEHWPKIKEVALDTIGSIKKVIEELVGFAKSPEGKITLGILGVGFVLGEIAAVASSLNLITATAWLITIDLYLFKKIKDDIQGLKEDLEGLPKEVQIDILFNFSKDVLGRLLQLTGVGYVAGTALREGETNPFSGAWEAITENAQGTDYWKGGLTWVGEQGRELVNLPRGTQIIPNKESEKIVAGKQITINQENIINNQTDPIAIAREIGFELARS